MAERPTRKVPEHLLSGASHNKPTVQDAPSGGMVTVACKLPHGLVIRNFDYRVSSEAVIGGGMRDFKQFFQVGPSITLNGYAVKWGERPQHDVFGNFALTRNVSADFWNRWWKDNQESDVVKNGLIFAYESADAVEGQAKDLASLVCGLEPLNPDKDNRQPRSLNPAVTLGPADRKAA